jgi:hypothetical protein
VTEVVIPSVFARVQDMTTRTMKHALMTISKVTYTGGTSRLMHDPDVR